MKATKPVMAFCDEMFERKARYGVNWPWSWKQKTREKMEAELLVESKGKNTSHGTEYYFTESGIKWYLEQRPDLASK